MTTMTKVVKVGSVFIGGGNPVLVQSMTTVDTKNVAEVLRQIENLQRAGCDIIRLAVTDDDDAVALKTIKSQTALPIVADIQFDYKLAIKALDNGADKVRVNPGNLGGLDKFLLIINKAKSCGASLRIGVNGGSIAPEFAHLPKEKALIESMMLYVNFVKKHDFSSVVLSAKASSVFETIRLNRTLSTLTDFPIHIGVTEAGTADMGIVKSSIGIGSLLIDGIGDTIRVSLTGDPLQEIEAAIKILRCCGIRREFVDVVSCPTCSRCKVDLKKIADEVSSRVKKVARPLKIAVMGCVVNGPGEAKDAYIGMAGAKDMAVFFRNGEVFRTVKENILEEFVKEVDKLIEDDFT